MCGIIFVDSKTPEQAKAVTRIQFTNQISRGQQGFGIVEVKKDIDKPKIRRALYTKPALEELDKIRSSSVMFHHRIPTSTSNTLNSTHPFRVINSGRKIFLIHNGVLTNEDEVLEKLNVNPEKLQSYIESKDSKGNVTYRYNDSEALAHDFLDALVTGRKTLHSAGSIAIVAYEPAINTVWLYRNEGNPLKIFRGGGVFMAASEAPGSDPSIKPETLYKYDLVTKEYKYVRPLKSDEGWSWTGDSSKGYSDYNAHVNDWSPMAEDGYYGHNDRSITRRYPTAGDEGKIQLPMLLPLEPTDAILAMREKDKSITPPPWGSGRTDLTHANKDTWLLFGSPIIRDCKLYNLLQDSEAHGDFMDEITYPDIFNEDIMDVDEFYTLVERIRTCAYILDELWVKDKKSQWYGCDTKAHTFILHRLRCLMAVYYHVESTFDYVCRKEVWIRDAITEAKGSVIAGIDLELNKPPESKKLEPIGFRTEGKVISSAHNPT